MRILSEMIVQLGWNDLKDSETEHGLFIGQTDEEVADCVLRLVKLLRKPSHVPFLAPIILREIHYRIRR